jgi:hypothetical protein
MAHATTVFYPHDMACSYCGKAIVDARPHYSVSEPTKPMHFVCRTAFNEQKAAELRASPLVGKPVKWRRHKGMGSRTLTVPAKVVEVLPSGRVRVEIELNGKPVLRNVSTEDLLMEAG